MLTFHWFGEECRIVKVCGQKKKENGGSQCNAVKVKTYIFSFFFSLQRLACSFALLSRRGTCHYLTLLCLQPPSPLVLGTHMTKHLVNFTPFVFPVIGMWKEKPSGFLGRLQRKNLNVKTSILKSGISFTINLSFVNSDGCSISKVLARRKFFKFSQRIFFKLVRAKQMELYWTEPFILTD